jgi:hypothetical protein
MDMTSQGRSASLFQFSQAAASFQVDAMHEEYIMQVQDPSLRCFSA